MSVLIPFKAPEPAGDPQAVSGAAEAPVVALRSGGSASHARHAARSRRARRWDPAYHVDLLRF